MSGVTVLWLCRSFRTPNEKVLAALSATREKVLIPDKNITVAIIEQYKGKLAVSFVVIDHETDVSLVDYFLKQDGVVVLRLLAYQTMSGETPDLVKGEDPSASQDHFFQGFERVLAIKLKTEPWPLGG